MTGVVVKLSVAMNVSGRAFLWLWFSFSLVGCSDEIVECWDWDGPVFQTDTRLPDAVLNQEYYAEILVEIDNEPYDDSFDYEFEYDTRELPQGLSFYQPGDNRELRLEGTPTEAGLFSFRIAVRAEGPVDICYHSTRDDFWLRVNEI